MTRSVDGDHCNAVVGQSGSHSEWAVVFVIAKTVSKNGHRPAIRRTRTGGNEKVKEQVFRTLNGWNASAGGHGGNKCARGFPVLCRELAERDSAHRTGEDL